MCSLIQNIFHEYTVHCCTFCFTSSFFAYFPFFFTPFDFGPVTQSKKHNMEDVLALGALYLGLALNMSRLRYRINNTPNNASALLNTPTFVNSAVAQSNHAEYTPVLMILILLLRGNVHVRQDIWTKIGGKLAVVSSYLFVYGVFTQPWVITRTSKQLKMMGVNMFRITGASLRYLSISILLVQIGRMAWKEKFEKRYRSLKGDEY